MLFKPKDRLKDLLFLDIALDSTVRTAIERGYEELNNAPPEVSPGRKIISIDPLVSWCCLWLMFIVSRYMEKLLTSQFIAPAENYVLHCSGS